MKKVLYLFILVFLSLSVSAQVDRTIQPKPGPAPKVNLGKPQKFTLPNGLTVLVVENHKLPRVTFSLSLDNPPIVEGNIVGVNYLTGNMMGNGTSKISKDEFNKKIDYYGAYGDFSIHNVSGTTLSRYFPEVLELVAQGALDPLFTQEELDSERAKFIENLKSQEKNAQYVARNVRSILLYGKNHPEGENPTEESINKITLDDVKKFYNAYFVPGNAYMVIVGDVKFADVKKLITENFSSWKKASAPKSVYIDPANLSGTEINLIDMPNAVQSEISVNNLVTLKMTDPDYFAALLANQILGGGGEGRLFLNLREAHGWTYGSYSSIQGDKYITNFTATSSVRNAVTDSAIVEMLNELDKVTTTLPTQDELDLAKAKYVGSFVMNAEKPQTVASFALREYTQNLPSNYYQDYIKNINAVTLEQVRDAAKKYILRSKSRIVVVGKAIDILPSLEKMNIPIKYFDKLGNPTAKPEMKTIDASVTLHSVLQKYINAIGGENTLKQVKTEYVVMKASVQGQEITITKKQAGNKVLQETSAMGMVLAKVMYDGTKGYISVQGQKTDMTEDVASEMGAGIFPELEILNSSTATLAGIEKIGDSDTYKVVYGRKNLFYDVNTGLKIAEEVTQEMKGQSMTQRMLYSDYKEIKGVKIPYILSMNMMGLDVEFNTTDIKINEGVSDVDFK